MQTPFQLVSDFEPKGDQPQAIEALTERIRNDEKYSTLLGVTGSGKTFTIANVIQELQRPTLVMSHNKTLAAQLYNELKMFFPNNAVEYFISYYDYYQPEAYLPQTDTYIEKDASINEDIERMRLAATSSLLQRRDVIVVASVSCIYGLGSPEDYKELVLSLHVGTKMNRSEILRCLVDIQYERNEIEFKQGAIRVRGDVLEVFPSYGVNPIRIELFDDLVEKIVEFNPLTGDILSRLEFVNIYPAKHFVAPYHKIEQAIHEIKGELQERLNEFNNQGKLLEAQRLESRTRFDLEMLQETGYCKGIENYSRFLSGRKAGERPATLMDFFPDDWLVVVDESHVTLPQIRGMYKGDQSRKQTLVEHGFRLPSALDNRPLRFEEYDLLLPQAVFISATPGPFEFEKNPKPVEQLIRPTGLLDPRITILPLKNQIDDLQEKIRERVQRHERILVTTLTKRMAEDLTEYLKEMGIRVEYLHSEIDAIKRVDILLGLRKKECDVVVGINLLREGLDLPEVSLVAVLDADKEGFLRSETSLIQTAGRAARHIHGEVIFYADTLTNSIKKAVAETNRRRQIQEQYNKQHGITPTSITKAINESLVNYRQAKSFLKKLSHKSDRDFSRDELLYELEAEMFLYAERLEFEKAAQVRDKIYELKDSGKKKR